MAVATSATTPSPASPPKSPGTPAGWAALHPDERRAVMRPVTEAAQRAARVRAIERLIAKDPPLNEAERLRYAALLGTAPAGAAS